GFQADRRCGGYPGYGAGTSHSARGPRRTPSRRRTSHGDLDYACPSASLGGCNLDREAALHRLIEVAQQFLEGFSLRRTAGDGRHLRPVAPFLGFVNNDFQLQFNRPIKGLRALQPRWNDAHASPAGQAPGARTRLACVSFPWGPTADAGAVG